MAIFCVKAKNNYFVDKKPRIYFTCHPEDFETCFQKICDDIWGIQDCAVYYTQDMTECIPEEELEVELGRHNLFVVPVTLKLLSTPNRAMDKDIPYAIEKHLPILPIMMEPGIDSLYAQPDKFGKLQYLNPYSTDLTEILYEEKLKKYLDAILVSDETAQRVRGAFDAYIFLSYRKKDRKYANALMQIIHSQPACRDIAIWFDEFLTPGEDFQENIQQILGRSKLFVLLVTPNLLEIPNYIMDKEYPAAQQANLRILPAEMQPTDRALLNKQFPNMPVCIDPRTDAAFQTLVLQAAKPELPCRSDPEHTYLIGLAYLDGIDTEVDPQLALELITEAAEADFPEAMKKLYTMYAYGRGVPIDYTVAIQWAHRLAQHHRQTYGTSAPETLAAMTDLADACYYAGQYAKSLEITQTVFLEKAKLLGSDHPDLAGNMLRMVNLYLQTDQPQAAINIAREICHIADKAGNMPATRLSALHNMAVAYQQMNDGEKALELGTQVYWEKSQLFGKTHSSTISSLGHLASIYSSLGKHKMALELGEEVYELRRKLSGETHPDTMHALADLAVYCTSGLGSHNEQKGFDFTKKAYAQLKKSLGALHPTTLITLGNLAVFYGELGDRETEITLLKETSQKMAQVLGTNHSLRFPVLLNLATAYDILRDFPRQLEVYQEYYQIQKQLLGAENPKLCEALEHLVYTYERLGDFSNVAATKERIYELRVTELGEESHKMRRALLELAKQHLKAQNYEKALALFQKAKALNEKVMGADDLSVLHAQEGIAETYCAMGKPELALALYQNCYRCQYDMFDGDFCTIFHALYRLGQCHLQLGNRPQALLLFRQLLEGSEANGGYGDPKILEAVSKELHES